MDTFANNNSNSNTYKKFILDNENIKNIENDFKSETYHSTLDDKYIILKTLGKGATSKVKLARHKIDNSLIAIKIIKKIHHFNNKLFSNELEMLKSINHENIIKIHDGIGNGILKKSNGVSKLVNYLVLELASNGELFDYIYFPKKGFGESIAHFLFHQLINGIEATHDNGIVHRDLKTENLMLDHDWNLKIADFGYSTLLYGHKGEGVLNTFLGTLTYSAPEIIQKKPYIGTSVDIFSCGVILFTLVTGSLPFNKADISDLNYSCIMNNDYEGFWSKFNLKFGDVSNEFKLLINSLLAFDPVQRPSIAEIKSHLWMIREKVMVDIVTEEFRKRKDKIQSCKHLKMCVVQAHINTTETTTTNNNILNSTYRSEIEKINYFSDRRVMNEYFESKNPYRVKINEVDPDNVLNIIFNYVNYVNCKSNRLKIQKIYMDEYKLKITSTISGQGQEQDLEFYFIISHFDSENYIIEMIKNTGLKIKFYEEYEKFIFYIKMFILI